MYHIDSWRSNSLNGDIDWSPPLIIPYHSGPIRSNLGTVLVQFELYKISVLSPSQNLLDNFDSNICSYLTKLKTQARERTNNFEHSWWWSKNRTCFITFGPWINNFSTKDARDQNFKLICIKNISFSNFWFILVDIELKNFQLSNFPKNACAKNTRISFLGSIWIGYTDG